MGSFARHGLMLAALAWSATVRADVTATDMQVAARALSFMEKPLPGDVRMGIVYSSMSPRSSRQARELRELIDGGLRVSGLEFTPELVEVGSLASARVDLYFLTEHIGAADIARFTASAASIPCVTTDIERVRQGACSMGVQSRPGIEVFVNRDAAKACGVRFATAFRVMINEL